MVVTHSYNGSFLGNHTYNFYLLMEDYIEAQALQMCDFNRSLERFARNLKFEAVLYRPFDGDIEAVWREIEGKPWSDAARLCLHQTPGLLILDVPFEKFDPQSNNWLCFNFDIDHHCENQKALKELADLVCQRQPLWDAFKHIYAKYRLAGWDNVFEIKPGIYGCSVDIVKGITCLKEFLKLYF